MKRSITPLASALATSLLVATFSVSANAECFYSYKAKRDNPLQLHYGVIKVDGPCQQPTPSQEIASRIARDGWTLLSVVGTVAQPKLSSERERAGEFFLKY
ncbi:MAG: hypothetical protein RL143_278 [Pseudomonadota bacterium]